MRLVFTVVFFTIFSSFTMFSQENTDVDLGKFLISADVNYTYRLTNIENSFNTSNAQYSKNLRSGMSYDISAYYMVKKNIGFGLKYNVYKSYESADDADITALNGDIGFGTASDDITVTFIGLSEIFDILKKSDKQMLNLEITTGYMHYKNEAYALGNYTITRGTIAAGAMLWYQYNAFKGFYIGPKVGFLMGTIGKYKVEGPDGFNEMIKLDSDKKELIVNGSVGLTVSYRF